MSAQVQTQTVHRPFGSTVVIALLAFTVGALGVVVTDAIVDRQADVATTTPATGWDMGRLEAMEGRQLAETRTSPRLWDQGMLDAIQGRQIAETVTVAPVLWDPVKLNAIEARQLAEFETPALWDQVKLDAMEGRQSAETQSGPVVWDSFMGESQRSLIGEFSHGQR